MYDFNYIIDPISTTQFLEEYYEKKILIIKRNSSNYYDSFLNVEAINRHLAEAEILYPSIRLVKEAIEVPSSEYTSSVKASNGSITSGIVEKDLMFQCFLNGNTIILNALEKANLNLLKLKNIFEGFFQSKVQINIYLTPFGSQGFKPHWDTHDVFIIQVGGSKHWKLYDSPIQLPTRKQNYKGDWDTTILPTQEILMRQGDCMYIPRGFVHEAITEDDYSLHITLGILPFSYSQLVRMVFDELENELFFRKSLPINFNSDKILASNFIENTVDFIKKVNIDNILNQMKDRFISQKIADTSNRLNDYLRYNQIVLETKVSKRESILFEIKEENENISIRFYDKSITFPIFTKTTLEFIVNNNTFSIDKIEGNLDSESNLLLCKRLIEEGFLTIVE